MVRKLVVTAAAAAVLASPLEAATMTQSTVQPGAFVGARFHLTLGGKSRPKPRAELAIAPTQSRFSNDGAIRTRIGEGLALSFTPHTKPTITLAGVRADAALGLKTGQTVDPNNKAGISTVGWVAIGVGTVALVAGGIWVAHFLECESDPDDNCGSD